MFLIIQLLPETVRVNCCYIVVHLMTREKEEPCQQNSVKCVGREIWSIIGVDYF